MTVSHPNARTVDVDIASEPRRRRRGYGYRPPRRLPLTRSGFAGVGGGRWRLMPAPATFMASSIQVCGLWPWIAGSPLPDVGVPLGVDQIQGFQVFGDPINWFTAGFISNPSVMVFGIPGLGKSTLVVRWILGLADQGIPSMVLGDLKGEYAMVIDALGGLVIQADKDFGINPVSCATLFDAAALIEPAPLVIDTTHPDGGRTGTQVAAELRAQALGQAAMLVIGLCRLARGSALADFEETLLTVAITLLHEQLEDPSLWDLDNLLEHGHPQLAHVAVTRTRREYERAVRGVLRSVRAILHGPMGAVFASRTSTPIPAGIPGGLCVDISPIADGDPKLLGGVMLAVWTQGFQAVDALWELAAALPEKYQWVTPLIVQDELWKPMSLAPGLAQLIDKLARTNRTKGVGEVKVTHSPKDATGLPSRADRVAAMSFAEKAGMLVMFGLAKTDLRTLDESAITLSQAEHRAVASWRSPRSFRRKRRPDGRPKPPPGAGMALIKVGEAPGIPIQVIATQAEIDLHDTNHRFTTRGLRP